MIIDVLNWAQGHHPLLGLIVVLLLGLASARVIQICRYRFPGVNVLVAIWLILTMPIENPELRTRNARLLDLAGYVCFGLAIALFALIGASS